MYNISRKTSKSVIIFEPKLVFMVFQGIYLDYIILISILLLKKLFFKKDRIMKAKAIHVQSSVIYYGRTKSGGVESGPTVHDAPVTGNNRTVDSVTDHHKIPFAFRNHYVFVINT